MTGDSTTAETADARSEGTGATGERDESDDGVTRRSFIRTTGATAAAGATVAAGSDDASAQAQTYRFGGEVAAWHGRAPPEIEGETNPSVELQAGNEYEFWFENLDGAPHNITIQDAQGNVIAQSELIQEEGATASVTFTATPQAAQYICTIHPTTMVADVNVTGELEGGQGGPSIESLALVGALALAFVSPLLFALFLFSRRSDGTDEAAVRR
ncbi:cupredoxin domain-containing protein [Halorussus aquaticus]|uniref:Plastocyanin/azurin family copper-binding protein n=1 Tax=Halorussus aquaticus TaxID=2953748 RepID=A0ABD5PXH1_9EURY|nr:cupredoxin domain-containing protein [Halorussus aquaticus]